MEEEVENREAESESPLQEKKWIYTWHNKWLTSRAGSIDDFIAIFEEVTERLKRWKKEGVVIDPDIIASYGDDFAQFCTYDEKIAIKEGFEEEVFEEDEEDPEEGIPDVEFQINKYLTVKLIDTFIQVYVDGKRFNQCRYLLIVDPLQHKDQDEIDSIDEAQSLYSNNLERRVTPEELGITKEQEFWAHCSNLQAWVENDYDTRLLHSNLSFPLLKKLTEVGDAKAGKVFKEEIAQRFVRGYTPVIKYLFQEKYLDYLTPEEFETILNELDYDNLILHLLLVDIGDFRASKYGTQFLLRVKKEFLEYFENNRMYVEAVSHHLDRSEYSPIVVTPDRQYFIRGSNDGKLKIFGIFNGDLVRVFGDHKGQFVSTLAISRDGKYVASSSDNFVKIWDYETGILIHTFEGHKDDVLALAFDPEGHFLVSGSGDDEMNESVIKVWDIREGKLKITLGSHWRSISSLSFSPNGKYLVSGAFDKTVNVWDTSTGRLLTTLVGHEKMVICVAITDERIAISASYDNTLKVWDCDTGKILQEEDFSELENISSQLGIVSFVLTPDQEYIIAGLQGPLEDGGLLFMWRLSDGENVQFLPIIQDFVGYEEELNHLAISNDGLFVLSASRDRMVKVWMEFLEYIDFQEIIQEMDV